MPGGIVGHLFRAPARIDAAEQTAKPGSRRLGRQTVVDENTHFRSIAFGRQLKAHAVMRHDESVNDFQEENCLGS